MGAFDFCSEVVEVTLPESVVTIDSVFDRCPNVTNIMVSESNPYLCSIDGNVFSKDKTKLIQYAVGKNEMSYSIPEGVKSIERNAFHNSKLANINMPESITSIGDWAFCNCANLTSLVFPKNVLKIGWQAFWLSENIADITFFNPNCEGIPSSCVGKATIHGYENSTAQAYAIKLGCKFESLGKTPVQNSLSGDFNSDGDLTVTDVVEFNQKLRSRKALPKNCDMNGDNVVNVIDLALLKQKLLSK